MLSVVDESELISKYTVLSLHISRPISVLCGEVMNVIEASCSQICCLVGQIKLITSSNTCDPSFFRALQISASLGTSI